MRSISDVDWAGKSVFEGSGDSGIKSEQDVGRFIFDGNFSFLFLFCFRLVLPHVRPFQKKKNRMTFGLTIT